MEGFFVKADLINEVIGITSNNCRNEVQYMSIASILPFLEKDYQKEARAFSQIYYICHTASSTKLIIIVLKCLVIVKSNVVFKVRVIVNTFFARFVL